MGCSRCAPAGVAAQQSIGRWAPPTAGRERVAAAAAAVTSARRGAARTDSRGHGVKTGDEPALERGRGVGWASGAS